ncbi:MAG: hypothetical protein MJE66_03795 [Proteobacteria bacterium]|nr:hypothetical protein [Pseudomonadota bacterium]
MGTSYHVAPLDESKLADVQALERQLGRVVVALEPDRTPAALSEDDLARLREAEARLGIVLVAYEAS